MLPDQFVRLIGDGLGGIPQGEFRDMFLQRKDFLLIVDQFQGGRHQFFDSIGIFHDEGGVLADQCHGVVGLVVFRNVRGRDEDRGLMGGAQFGNRAGAGAGDDYVRDGIGQVHPADEIGIADGGEVFAGGRYLPYSIFRTAR